MARDVTHEADGPYVIDEDEFEEQGGTVYICECGLSDTKPFCDGSHTAVADEDDGVVYRYDEDGERTVVDEK